MPVKKGKDPRKPDDEKASKLARSMALYSTLIVILPSSVLAGYWIGAALDEYFGSAPWLSTLLILLGAVVGFHQMYRIITKAS